MTVFFGEDVRDILIQCLRGASVATLVLAGCTSSKDPVPVCVQEGPAFRLLVQAPQGQPLPGNTRLRASYQGNLEERYELGDRSQNEDLCCATLATIQPQLAATPCGSDGGAPLSVPARAIACDLWSNGAARVTLSASGYDTTVQDLEAVVNEDCETIQTRELVLVLERGDAASD